ncbi:MAG: SdiA-regulated domain-containing protein [Bacteroidota bacterium]
MTIYQTIGLLIFCFAVSCVAASDPPSERPVLMWRDTLPLVAQQYDFPYDLAHPDKTFELPSILTEISGLDIAANGKRLLAVQDEQGIVFQISTRSGRLKQQFKFHKNGDYEGIERVGADLFVVKNTGTIYEIKNYSSVEDKVAKINKFNTYLDSSHNVEGLAYDPQQHRLLLACKGSDKKNYKMKKQIYSFDLATHTLDTTPVYEIDQQHIMNYLGMGKVTQQLERVAHQIDPTRSYFAFSPSAIAVHPRTGNLYVTSSVGKLLVVLNPEGELLHIERLDKKIHRQPEGLAFAKNGTLYISNEGKKGTGKIQVFKP